MISTERKKELMKKSNVNGVGIGRKEKDGQPTGEDCVTVFVRQKKPETELSAEDVVPSEVDGSKTDVVEVGDLSAQRILPAQVSAEGVDTKRKMRPFSMGMSIGHYDVTAGTAGFVGYVKKTKTLDSGEVVVPAPVVCTNNHVAANENDAEEGDSVLQPGIYDGGDYTDSFRFGGLHSFVEIESDDNLVDKALVSVEGRSANSFIPKIGVPRSTTEVEVGDRIAKFGRTTGYREGEVRAVGVRVRVRFGNGVKEFDDQILTTAVSKPGDSGSAGVALPMGESPELFGVLFAGSSNVTVFNSIDNYLSEGEQVYLNPEDVYGN